MKSVQTTKDRKFVLLGSEISKTKEIVQAVRDVAENRSTAMSRAIDQFTGSMNFLEHCVVHTKHYSNLFLKLKITIHIWILSTLMLKPIDQLSFLTELIFIQQFLQYCSAMSLSPNTQSVSRDCSWTQNGRSSSWYETHTSYTSRLRNNVLRSSNCVRSFHLSFWYLCCTRNTHEFKVCHVQYSPCNSIVSAQWGWFYRFFVPVPSWLFSYCDWNIPVGRTRCRHVTTVFRHEQNQALS